MTLSNINDDIEWLERDIAEAKADGDARLMRALKVEMKDLKAEKLLILGADPETVEWGTPPQTGIHSGDIRFKA